MNMSFYNRSIEVHNKIIFVHLHTIFNIDESQSIMFRLIMGYSPQSTKKNMFSFLKTWVISAVHEIDEANTYLQNGNLKHLITYS